MYILYNISRKIFKKLPELRKKILVENTTLVIGIGIDIGIGF